MSSIERRTTGGISSHTTRLGTNMDGTEQTPIDADSARQITLTEFLTARINEDAQPTWTLTPYECAPGCCAPAGWVGAQCRYCDRAPIYGGTFEAMMQSARQHAQEVHQRSRVLAECEAKRLLIERVGNPDWAGFNILALPYADHPDYRGEWKP